MIPKEILKQVRRIEIVTSRLVNDVMAGEYHSVFKGRGMEFDEVREYSVGDDVRAIDWNVTARAAPYVKRYVEERELTVMLVVDASGSGDFGSATHMKSEVAVDLCAALAFAAIRNHDRIGLIIFTDEIELYIPPKKGRNHVLRVIRELLYFRPTRKATSIPRALEFLNKVTTRRAVTFLVSDFQDTGLDKPLSLANRRHDLVAFTITDPRERELPPVGLVELEDGETGQIVLVDTSDETTRREFARAGREERARLERMFRSLEIDFVPIDTDKPFIEPLMRFFHQRARRR